MGKIFCLMGKSASGKDTLYRRLLEREDLALSVIVPWTTRPIREGEEEGREYYFATQERFKELKESQKVVESRVYHTVHGDWYYFTVDDEGIELSQKDYLIIGTLQSYNSIREYYGRDRVIGLYVTLDDGERLERALKRERSQKEPKYKEMCRRFLADQEDFSEEKLAEAGIERCFVNDDLERCLDELSETILSYR